VTHTDGQRDNAHHYCLVPQTGRLAIPNIPGEPEKKDNRH